LRTFGLLGLAVAMLGAGYFFVPSPGASPLPMPATRTAAAVPPAAAPPSMTPSAVPAGKPPAALAASRPPVPLLTPAHHNYYVLKESAAKEAADKDKAS